MELEGLQHTSIPVSKVHQTYRVDGHLYIEMDYTQGDTLQAIWTSGILSPSEKQAIAKQVADYINQLRMLEPPQRVLLLPQRLDNVSIIGWDTASSALSAVMRSSIHFSVDTSHWRVVRRYTGKMSRDVIRVATEPT